MKDRLSGRKGRSAHSQRKVDPLISGAKMAPYLWRADLSFRNSVTGSGIRAMCSNILQGINSISLIVVLFFVIVLLCKAVLCVFFMRKTLVIFL